MMEPFFLVVKISWSNVVWRWFDSNFFLFSIEYRARDHTFWTGQLTTFTCYSFESVNGDQSAMESFALSTVFCWMIIIIMMWDVRVDFPCLFVFCLMFWYWTDDGWRLATIWKLYNEKSWPIAYFKNAITFLSLFISLRLLEEINDSIG